MRQEEIDLDIATNLYINKRLSYQQASVIIGCSPMTLRSRLKEAGVKNRTPGESRRKVDPKDILQEYRSGISINQIARNHDMSYSSIRGCLARQKVEFRSRKEETRKVCTKIPPSGYPQILKRYEAGESPSAIAKGYGVHKTTIHLILKKQGLVLESIGIRNGNYKGGVTALHTRIRHGDRYKQWMKDCMKRDNWTCQITGKQGRLNVHHQYIAFSDLFKDFLSDYSDLDPIVDVDRLFELSNDYELFWDLDNGLTLSVQVHKAIHKHDLDYVKATYPS